MLTFNRPQFIGRAIEGSCARTIEDWELIVVHDGPNGRLNSHARLGGAEPRLRYFRRYQRGNIAEATNFGIRQALGTYIAILDDDDYWRVSDKLERQIQFLEEHAEYVACGGGAVCVGENNGQMMAYLKPQHDRQIKSQALLANPMVTPPPCTAATRPSG